MEGGRQKRWDEGERQGRGETTGAGGNNRERWERYGSGEKVRRLGKGRGKGRTLNYSSTLKIVSTTQKVLHDHTKMCI